MIKIYTTIIAAAAFVIFPWSGSGMASSHDVSLQKTLERDVDQLRSGGPVSKRHQIDKFYELARLYESNGSMEKAVSIFEEALQVDSANLSQQMHYARLLIKSDKKNIAAKRLLDIYRFAEDEELFRESKKLLNNLKVKIPDPEYNEPVNNHIGIKLIPVGNPNRQVIKE